MKFKPRPSLLHCLPNWTGSVVLFSAISEAAWRICLIRTHPHSNWSSSWDQGVDNPAVKWSTSGIQTGVRRRTREECVIPWAPALLILRGFKAYYGKKNSGSFYFLMPKCFQPYYFILFKSYKLYFSLLPKIPRSCEEHILKKGKI